MLLTTKLPVYLCMSSCARSETCQRERRHSCVVWCSSLSLTGHQVLGNHCFGSIDRRVLAGTQYLLQKCDRSVSGSGRGRRFAWCCYHSCSRAVTPCPSTHPRNYSGSALQILALPLPGNDQHTQIPLIYTNSTHIDSAGGSCVQVHICQRTSAATRCSSLRRCAHY